MNKYLILILHRGIQARIESFKLRNEQLEIFKRSNELSIKSLQARLKGDTDTYNNLWQQSIDLKNDAKSVGEESLTLQEKASNLEGIYYSLCEEFAK